ncbi:MAG: hypothetical protein JSR46_02975, partial [Verrucomicrobia bacterium]|nr:hypothetical protein [Verrucomicrobiota bacterium]
MNKEEEVPYVPNPGAPEMEDITGQLEGLTLVDGVEYTTYIFESEEAFVKHFVQSGLEAHAFLCNLAQNRKLNRTEKKNIAKGLKKAASEEYLKQTKDDSGRVVLKLPKAQRTADSCCPDLSPCLEGKKDCLSVYLFSRNETAHFRGEVADGELSPDFVDAYLQEFRWVKQIAEMDKGKVVCLFCQEESCSKEKAFAMRKLSGRTEEALVEAKCWISCENCADRLPLWDGEEEDYKKRGVAGPD